MKNLMRTLVAGLFLLSVILVVNRRHGNQENMAGKTDLVKANPVAMNLSMGYDLGFVTADKCGTGKSKKQKKEKRMKKSKCGSGKCGSGKSMKKAKDSVLQKGKKVSKCGGSGKSAKKVSKCGDGKCGGGK